MSRWIAALNSVLIVAVATATPASGQSLKLQSPPPAIALHERDPVAAWKQWLQTVSDKLVAGRFEEANRMTDDVLVEMLERIRGGDGTAPLLAVALLYRAVGAAGQGREREAAWDFAVAQNLDSRLTTMDLSAFGAVGAALDPWRLLDDPTSSSEGTEIVEPGRRVVPPRRKTSPKPAYPLAKNVACVQGSVVVQMLIDRQGFPTHPRVVRSEDPLLALAALDAIREWRFRPAKRGGEPVSVRYNLTVNFKSPRCDAGAQAKGSQ
jgi:TonB family protein